MSKSPRNSADTFTQPSPAQLWRHLHISWLTHPPVTRGHCSQGKCFNTSDVSQSPGKLVARSIRRTSSSLLLNINEIFREVLTATQTIVILILWSWAGAGAVFMQSFVILAIIFIAPTIMVHIRRGRAGPSQGE